MASEYNYVRPVEEKKAWDKFATTLESGGSASEQHTGKSLSEALIFASTNPQYAL